MTVTVVIVNYNSGHCLRRCITSLYHSDYPLDIVVVDNHSRDHSLDGLEDNQNEKHHFKIIHNQTNKGFSKAVNMGAKDSHSDFIFLLNPDCTVFPHTVRKLVDSFSSNPNAGIMGALVFNDDGSEQRGCRRREPTLKRSAATALGLTKWFEGIDLTQTPLSDEPESVDAVSGAAMMIRRDVFVELMGMDEQYFLHCEDLDICRRARDYGYDVMLNPHTSVFHTQGQSSQTNPLQVEKYKHKGMIQYYNEHYKHRSQFGETFLTKALVYLHYSFLALKFKLRPKKQHCSHTSQSQQSVAQFDTNTTDPLIVVTGARSDVGAELMNQLSALPYRCIAVSRQEHGSDSMQTNHANLRWYSQDYLNKVPPDDLGKVDIWINVAPVWLMPRLYHMMGRFSPNRIIALSSTSIKGKSDSSDLSEQKIVKQLKMGEKWVLRHSHEYGEKSTILRPSMIYGGPHNQNLNLIETWIRTFRFLPFISGLTGKRQPVHASDVAAACVTVISNTKTFSNTYTIAGGEVVGYRQMVEQLFIKRNIKPRFLPLPRGLIKSVLTMASKIPGFSVLSPEMVSRMSKDLVYSNARAQRDFDFKPRKYQP